MHTFPKTTRLLLFLVVALAALSLGACGFNLAGDVTPPPGWHPTAVPPTPNTADLYPALPPDPVAGKAIYQQRCQKCHGATGLGDGPQAAALDINPAALADPEEARADVPAKRFAVLTQGKMDEGMPTFAHILTARERWDVLAYIYTLSVPPATLQHGKALYTDRCQVCHEADGHGKDLVNQKRMAQASDEALAKDITGEQHPPEVYEGLSMDDRLALAAYIRTLSFAHTQATATATPTGEAAAATAAAPTPAEGTGTPAAEASATPETTTTPQANTITVTGQVTNGTQGSSVPPDLEVTLHGYDKGSMNEVYKASATIDADGKFVFHNVPYDPQRIFFVTAEYAKVLYGSRTATALPDHPSLNLPLTIYETTTDPSHVRVERLHVFVSPQTDQAIQVVEMYIITNEGDRTLVSADPEKPVLTFDLPAGAVHLQFQNGSLGGRYVQTAHGFGDMLPVYPQVTTQEVFAYTLPFEGKEMSIAHPVPLPVAAAVLMAPEGQLTLSGQGLTDGGVQKDETGNTFRIYNVAALNAGDTLAFTVRRVGNGLSLGGNKTSLAIGLLALGAALIAIAVVLTRREGPAPAAPAAAVPSEIADDPDALMDAILALDDLYEEGKIEEEAYRRRRKALKDRLKTLLAAAEDKADT